MHRVFKRLEIPKTLQNRRALAAWIQAEGGNARNNPLNTTKEAPGATNYNSVGVKSYPSEAIGVDANVGTFRERGMGYEAILRSLRGNRRATETLDAVAASRWGTGTLPHQILGELQERPDYLRELERREVAR